MCKEEYYTLLGMEESPRPLWGYLRPPWWVRYVCPLERQVSMFNPESTVDSPGEEWKAATAENASELERCSSTSSLEQPPPRMPPPITQQPSAWWMWIQAPGTQHCAGCRNHWRKSKEGGQSGDWMARGPGQWQQYWGSGYQAVEDPGETQGASQLPDGGNNQGRKKGAMERWHLGISGSRDLM